MGEGSLSAVRIIILLAVKAIAVADSVTIYSITMTIKKWSQTLVSSFAIGFNTDCSPENNDPAENDSRTLIKGTHSKAHTAAARSVRYTFARTLNIVMTERIMTPARIAMKRMTPARIKRRSCASLSRLEYRSWPPYAVITVAAIVVNCNGRKAQKGSPLYTGALLPSVLEDVLMWVDFLTYARLRSPIKRHRTGARPIVSSRVAVVSRSDFSGFMAARPSPAAAIRKPERMMRGSTMGRHV